MLAGVHIICFAASYSIALVLEISRLVFRSGVRGAVMLAFAGAGWIAHTAFLYYRASSLLSSSQDWYLLAAWVLVLIYLYLTWFHPKQHFGVFLLPLVLGLVATARWFADPQPLAREPVSQAWGIVHAVSSLLATVSVLVGFAAGIMYLSQVRRLKGRRTLLAPLRLPSLEWLERASGRAVVVSTLMMGVGLVSGILLNVINYRRHDRVLPWNDPLVLATLGMFAWLLAAVVFGAIYRPARRGRKVAYLTLASFVFLVIALRIALGMGLFMRTQHGRPRGAEPGATSFSILHPSSLSYFHPPAARIGGQGRPLNDQFSAFILHPSSFP
jgi:ABC-type uncharacterized transport system permease subunit